MFETGAGSSGGEHCLHTAGVGGSNPLPPTNHFKELGRAGTRPFSFRKGFDHILITRHRPATHISVPPWSKVIMSMASRISRSLIRP